MQTHIPARFFRIDPRETFAGKVRPVPAIPYIAKTILTPQDAIASHVRWKITLLLAATIHEPLTERAAHSIHHPEECSIGKWLLSKHTPIFAARRMHAVLNLHAAFHSQMSRIANLIQAGETSARPNRQLNAREPFQSASSALANAIMALQRSNLFHIGNVAKSPVDPNGSAESLLNHLWERGARPPPKRFPHSACTGDSPMQCPCMPQRSRIRLSLFLQVIVGSAFPLPPPQPASPGNASRRHLFGDLRSTASPPCHQPPPPLTTRPQPQRSRRDRLHHLHPGSSLPHPRSHITRCSLVRFHGRSNPIGARRRLVRLLDRHGGVFDVPGRHPRHPDDGNLLQVPSSISLSASASSFSGCWQSSRPAKCEWYKLPILGDFALKQAQS